MFKATPKNPGFDRGWMLMLGDLLALLLSVFVLVHAMSALPAASWQALRAGLAQQPAAAAPPLQAAPVRSQAGTPLAYVQAMLETQRGAIALLDDTAFTMTPDALALTLPMDAATWPRRELAALVALLRPHDNRLAVAVSGQGWISGLAQADELAAALAGAGYDRPIDRRVAAAAAQPALALVILARQAEPSA
ncbi:MAG: hypothetical protein Tsb0016_03990 [Sphingomonadales bacterium]